MRFLFGLICVCSLAFLPMVGCSETADPAGNGGEGGGGTGGDGGADTVTITAFVSGWDPELGSTGALEGVAICQTDTTNCVSTDAGGNAAVEVPAAQEASYTMDLEGYGSYLDPVLLSEAQAVALPMATDDRFSDMHGLVMSPYPMEGTGSIFVELVDDPIAGATFELSSGAGQPYYWDEDKNWDAELSATTSTGGGGFTEVAPGEYQIEIGGAATNCVLTPKGWPGDSPNTVRVPVREGYLTRAVLICEEITR
ncbi:MAG: hypothetical protein KJO40_10805 [Deltaproteobacteria bacterium]|nr:hypothetical protein [Deltaproteobacteria bacterium]NND28959.1 hypothetical protein [Myxococcales bacterium]MBT8463313.1 hypothetical protein [Deltaproteobacteria bacterium]MBT8481643.1 hypothetical protein [Deltaproteobacteria bacterium]NNK09010.1 hypothetical protein [Myxococcales bacterium]